MDPVALRASFPVFEQRAYLNAGTCGPLPATASEAIDEVLEVAVAEGRAATYFQGLIGARDRLRPAYAELLRARPEDVALTTCTSEGIVRVLAGLDLRAGDEILTSDDEHPGLLGPLAAARAQRGIDVRSVPFAELADAVSPATTLVACSHVNWVDGRLAPDFTGLDIPVLLDGAQGVGAVAVDVAALGCAFYAGSGQKWLCGPVGTGMLWIAPEWSERVAAPGPTYMNLEDASLGLDAVPKATAARHDAFAQSPETLTAALAALDILGAAGWDAVHERAATLAETFARMLAERGLQVAPRDRTPLVSWKDPDPPAARDRLAAAGVVIRDLPGRGLLRASVGAWNDESDLERLLAAL
jgi:selenocysteine lyase/cysteine desulfurase